MELRQQEELGLTLMKRSENGVTLTAAGRLFWEEAGELIEQLDQAALRVKRQCGSDRLRIGYLPAFVAGLMPPVLARFKATIGGPVPELLDLTPQEIVAKANAGKLDIAFLPRELGAKVPDFQWTSFRSIKPVLIMPKRHPLAKLRQISPSVLQGLSSARTRALNFPRVRSTASRDAAAILD
jgi:DNA-binding transcriptional LysR family regulator